MGEIAIYCRVSTEGQEQDGTSLQTQLEACRKYCRLGGMKSGMNLAKLDPPETKRRLICTRRLFQFMRS